MLQILCNIRNDFSHFLCVRRADRRFPLVRRMCAEQAGIIREESRAYGCWCRLPSPLRAVPPAVRSAAAAGHSSHFSFWSRGMNDLIWTWSPLSLPSILWARRDPNNAKHEVSAATRHVRRRPLLLRAAGGCFWGNLRRRAAAKTLVFRLEGRKDRGGWVAVVKEVGGRFLG